MIYFVTGTDTAAGKTHVTGALTRALRAAGRDARAVKPIETGWDAETSDAARLAEASGRTVADTVLLRFALARSPRSAAEAEGRPIDLAAVADWCGGQTGEIVLVEGAGGWRVPLAEGRTIADLAATIGAPVIIAGRAGLGTINHTVLTIEAVRARGLRVVAAVLSRRPDDDLDFARENAREIEAQTGARVALIPDDLAAIVAWF